jgi:hypothetical protein
MKKTLYTSLASTALVASAFAGTIDFSSPDYTLGELDGQSADGASWYNTETLFNVVSDGAGGQYAQSADASLDPAVNGFQRGRNRYTSTFFGGDSGPVDDNYTGGLAYSFDFSIGDTFDANSSNSKAWFIALLDDGVNEQAIAFSVYENGDLSYKNGATSVIVEDVFTAANQFVTVSGVLDYATQKYSLYLGGTVVSTSLDFAGDAEGNVQLIFQNSAATDDANYFQLGVDNISLEVTTVPEPSAFALLLGGAALLLVGVRRR